MINEDIIYGFLFLIEEEGKIFKLYLILDFEYKLRLVICL